MANSNCLAWFLLVCCVVTVGSPWGRTTRAADELLSVGSKAPALSVEHWFKRADGQLPRVTKLERGKVYVVEFWATWCNPCIKGMPHIAQLQREYAEKNVQIIGISSEELSAVQAFLKQPAPSLASQTDSQASPLNGKDKSTGGTSPTTFEQITSVYSLACDPDESTEKAYMQAAFQSTIPKAFIVGKEGIIEWIGHPGEMDDVLRQVVSGTWQREEFGRVFLAEQKATMARAKLSDALQRRNFANATELIDSRLKEASEPQEQLELRLTKIQISIAQKNMTEASQRLQECFDFAGGRVDMIDLVCWHVYEQAEQRSIDLTALVRIALAEGEKALTKAKEEQLASLLDTVGHLAYKSGDKAKAIQLVTRATELATGENLEFSKQFLEQLKSAP